ncbi:MAG: Glu-tRNA(Gln) amidotransferase subunit GatE [Candidatus Bathyarchaeia archaeon]
MQVDYAEIGLLVGLECHQQLATREKLFCSCKPQLFSGDPEITFLRRLRPTQSELGQVDPAAYFEFKKGVKILYEANNETSCLVEMDEEPPHELNREALEIALTVALMTDAKPIDEVHVMRKTVIDGSNTTGFQRTCIVALEGVIEVDGKEIPIQHIGLEEDAARKMKEEGSLIHYRIDRLGIPLIEVTTGPVIYSPKEAERVALAIGQILRATGRVKRGIGTIRQDLNISIRDGALMEIKGVQELDLVSKVVEYEVQRQLNLLKIRGELERRGLIEEDLREEFIDVTSIFSKTSCRVIRKAISRNQRVLAVRLLNFAGLLRFELAPGIRFGKEMADRARFWGRVGGIFHTDEIPNYGITAEEVEQLKRFTEAEEEDCVVFVADSRENAVDALRAVVQRAREALKGVPEETRAPNPDGTTRYMRPRPGAARMYPETDVPPIRIEETYLERLRSRLPELPRERMARLIRQYGVNEKLARQLLYSEYTELFESIAKEVSVSPTVIAVALTETLKALRRDGVPVGRLSNEQITDAFRLVDSGRTAKEAIPEVLAWLARHEGAAAVDAVEALGLVMISQENLEAMIDELIGKNEALIKERGERAFGILMGRIMREVRGRVKAEDVSRLLKDKLSKMLK